MFCSKCGAKLVEGATFCQKCGAKVYNEKIVPAKTLNATETVRKAVSEENVPDQSNVPVAEQRINIIPPYKMQKDPKDPTDISYLEGIERKALFSEFKSVLNKYVEKYTRLTLAWQIGIALCLSLFISLGIGLIMLVIYLFFSSFIAMIVVAAGGYIVYQRWIAEYITLYIYVTKSKRLQLPEGMSAHALLEALSGKFNYPYFKGIRYDENGECVIEGQYSVYPIVYDKDNTAYLTCSTDSNDKKYRTILLESLAICSYINKFFNPTLQMDVTKDLKALKAAEIQRKMVAVVLSVASFLITIIIAFHLVVPGGLRFLTSPGMEVRNAYLSQYSDEVTIEEAFNNFFDNGKWSKYKEDGYSYVVFTGACQYLGERADVRITFKITGENFIVDSLDINGRVQNDFMVYSMLSAVYKDY